LTSRPAGNAFCLPETAEENVARFAFLLKLFKKPATLISRLNGIFIFRPNIFAAKGSNLFRRIFKTD